MSADAKSVREIAREAITRGDIRQRTGQRVFNWLAAYFPEVVEDLRGGPLDPFHDDKRIGAFVAEVEARVSR